MKHQANLSIVAAALLTMGMSTSALPASSVQIGSSGKTFASSATQCAVNPATGVSSPTIQAGLFNPAPHAKADLRLNGIKMAELTSASPTADLWLADGNNSVTLTLSRRVTDTYAFTVLAGQCSLPPGNFYSADGTLEYAASGKSYLTVQPGCALNPATGLTQPFVNLFDNGTFLLNVSVNGVPLTQLSASRPHVPVFLVAGQNLITAVNGTASTDTYFRSGGSGSCVLP